MYLSFFSLSRVILLAKRLRANDLLSMSAPVADMDRVVGLIDRVKVRLTWFWIRYTPWIVRLPLTLKQGMPSDRRFSFASSLAQPPSPLLHYPTHRLGEGHSHSPSITGSFHVSPAPRRESRKSQNACPDFQSGHSSDSLSQILSPSVCLGLIQYQRINIIIKVYHPLVRS